MKDILVGLMDAIFVDLRLVQPANLDVPEPAGPLICSLITWALMVWGAVWILASFLGAWAEIPLVAIVSIHWFAGLPSPFIPWHGPVVPPVGNFIFTCLVLGAWGVSLWIILG